MEQSIGPALYWMFFVIPAVFLVFVLVYVAMIQAFSVALLEDWRRLKSEDVNIKKGWLFYSKIMLSFIIRLVITPFLIAGVLSYFLYDYLM